MTAGYFSIVGGFEDFANIRLREINIKKGL